MRHAFRKTLACLGLAVLFACSSGEPPRGVAAPRGKNSVPVTIIADPRVDAAAHAACLTGDSLLRQLPGSLTQWQTAVSFDSVWYSTTVRWACRVAAVGHTRDSWLSVDTIMKGFKQRGWNDQTQIAADGPDGTVQGVHHAGVTCVIEGRWDGGDDSDTTYVPNDTIEVHVACTRTVASDTIYIPPVVRPQSPPKRARDPARP